eukprot:6252833-Amphidinium_carterae.1
MRGGGSRKERREKGGERMRGGRRKKHKNTKTPGTANGKNMIGYLANILGEASALDVASPMRLRRRNHLGHFLEGPHILVNVVWCMS